MSDIKALLREAAECVDANTSSCLRPLLAERLEAAAEWMGDPLDEAITRLEAKLAAAEEELTRYRNGYQGSCYACEAVGEKNVELEDNVKVLWEALDAIAESDPDESSGRLRDIANEALATTEDDPDDDFTRGTHGL